MTKNTISLEEMLNKFTEEDTELETPPTFPEEEEKDENGEDVLEVSEDTDPEDTLPPVIEEEEELELPEQNESEDPEINEDPVLPELEETSNDENVEELPDSEESEGFQEEQYEPELELEEVPDNIDDEQLPEILPEEEMEPVIEEEEVPEDPVEEIMEGIATHFDREVSEMSDGEPEHQIGDITSEMDQVGSDVSRLSKMSSALEAYGELLEQSYMETGAINKKLLQSVKIGLESFNEPVLMDTVFSNESFHVRLDLGSNDLQNLMTGVKKAGTLLKEASKQALKQLIELLRKLFKAVRERVIALTGMNRSLEERLNKLGRWNNSKKATVDVSNSLLFINGYFSVNQVNNLNRLVNLTDALAGNAITTLFENIQRAYVNNVLTIQFEKSHSDLHANYSFFIEDVKEAIVRSGLVGSTPDTSGDSAKSSMYDTVYTSGTLLGDYRIVIAINNTPKNLEQATSDLPVLELLQDIKRSVSIAFERQGSNASPVKAVIPDVQVLKEMFTNVKKINSELESVSNVEKVMEQNLIKFDNNQVIRRAATRLGIDRDEFDMNVVSEMVMFTGGLLGYLTNISASTSRFIEDCVKYYENELGL